MAEHKHSKRTHKWAFPLGMVILLLAIIGMVSLISLARDGYERLRQNPKEIAQYEEFLRPIIEHDPDPFDSVEKANTLQLLDISIWSLLRADPDAKRYQTEAERGRIIIPQVDVEAEYKKLFGKEVSVHGTIEGADYTFVYDAENQAYYIPQTGTLSIYVPRVKTYKKVGNSVELEVEYLGYSTIDWADAPDGVPVQPEPMKTMMITLYVGEDDSFTIGSIRVPVGQQSAALEAPGNTRIPQPEDPYDPAVNATEAVSTTEASTEAATETEEGTEDTETTTED